MAGLDGIAGKYRILRTVADGGLGVVHEGVAEDGIKVAIKMLGAAALNDPAARARFAREVRVCGMLRGRHVARLLDEGALDGAPYLVMELLEGRDLGRELKQQPSLPIADAAAIMTQVACGVAEAHSHGIVHRDLKPKNIFLANEGALRVVKVLDFGISKLADDDVDDDLTRSFAMLGTPAYMSPEQIRGAHAVDRATDVWSFGMVLFRVLAGRLPFRGNESSIPIAICEDPPDSLLEIRPEVPRDLVDAIQAALEKDKRLRPTLADLGDVLIGHVDASANAAIAHQAYSELARMSLAELH